MTGKLKIFQIDAFTNELFRGNPAGVCPLEAWLPDELMQNIAAEMNLSETAFFVGADGSYGLRWFTPVTEIDLCGHATLATAWVLANELGATASPFRFSTRSGELLVKPEGKGFTLDFPAEPPVVCQAPGALLQGLGNANPREVLSATDYLVILESESQVRALKPDFNMLKELPLRGVIVSAPGDNVDFVSRWFGCNVGVAEDPVTGSAHTTLVPYWSGRLGKDVLKARQISRRGGELDCRLVGKRVLMTGSAVKFLEGEIEISPAS